LPELLQSLPELLQHLLVRPQQCELCSG